MRNDNLPDKAPSSLECAGGPERARAAKRRLIEYGRAPALLTHKGEAGRVSLEDQLKKYTADDDDPMPPALIQKYIAYAKTYVKPSLSDAAKAVSLLFLALKGQIGIVTQSTGRTSESALNFLFI